MNDDATPNPDDMNDVTLVSNDTAKTVSSPAGNKTITAWLEEKGIDVDLLNVSASPCPDMRTGSEKRYTIGAELSRGGMGAVLSATDLNLRREVAMKVILKTANLHQDDGRVMRFLHEAQVTGQLEHPSIVPVYELGEDDQNGSYYTMKYIRGTNLGDEDARRHTSPLKEFIPLPGRSLVAGLRWDF